MPNSITVDFQANVARFSSAIDRATNDLNKFQSNAERVSGNITKAFGALGVGLSAAGVVAFFKDTIDAAEESSQSILKLQAILKSTGSVVGFTATELERMAQAMASSSQFDDEAIRKGMAEIIKFGNITGQVFTDTLQVVKNYAAFSGEAFPEAAAQISRALASPESASKILKKTVGDLSEAQKNLIVRLKETGHEAEAQQIVLDKLNSAFSDVEQTMNVGVTAASKNLNKQWKELMETLGQSGVGPVKLAMNSLAGAVQGINNALVELDEKYKKSLFFNNKSPLSGLSLPPLPSEPGAPTYPPPLIGKVTLEDFAAVQRESAKKRADAVSAIAETQRKLEPDILKNNLKIFEDSIKKEDSLLAFRNKVLDFYYGENIVSIKDYYEEKKTVQDMALAATLAGYDKEIAALEKFKSGNGRDQKEITDAKAQIATLKEKKNDATLKNQEMSVENFLQQSKEARKSEIEGKQVLIGLEKDFQNELEKRMDALNAPLLSASEKLLADDLRSVTKRAQDSRIELEKLHVAGSLSVADYDKRLQQVTADEEKQKEALRATRVELDKNNASWKYGADVALSSYLDEVQNIAKSSERIFTDAFKGMEDALVNFVHHGKLDFNSLANSIIDDLIRIQVKQSITGPLAASMGQAGGVGNWVSNLFKGNGGGLQNMDQNMPILSSMIPGYAVGTDYVPRDMIAQIHQGERIIPASQNNGSGIVVNVINNASQQVTATPQQNQSGGFDLIISQIESKIGSNIIRGTGAVNAAVSQTFGLNRVAGAY